MYRDNEKFEEELTRRFEIDTTIWRILTQALKCLKNPLLAKTEHIMFELKKFRGVTFDRTDNWRKLWRKTDLCFQKWHEKLGKFSQAWKLRFHFKK